MCFLIVLCYRLLRSYMWIVCGSLAAVCKCARSLFLHNLKSLRAIVLYWISYGSKSHIEKGRVQLSFHLHKLSLFAEEIIPSCDAMLSYFLHFLVGVSISLPLLIIFCKGVVYFAVRSTLHFVGALHNVRYDFEKCRTVDSESTRRFVFISTPTQSAFWNGVCGRAN